MEGATIRARPGSRRAAWVALAIAFASLVNAIVIMWIVFDRKFERLAPTAALQWPGDLRPLEREGLGRLTNVSFGGAAIAVALAATALALQRRPGTLPCGPMARAAIGIAMLAAMVAGGAGLVGGVMLTPFS